LQKLQLSAFNQTDMKNLLTLIFVATVAFAYGQTDYDNRLLAKFSEERIKELQQTQPQIIEYWTYYLDESYQIVGTADGKTLPSEKTIKIKDFNNLNILELDVQMDRSMSKSYKIKSTGEYLVLLSNEAFSAKFNRSRGLKSNAKR